MKNTKFKAYPWTKQHNFDEDTCSLDYSNHCFVKEIATSMTIPCKFPFKYNGTIHHYCTKHGSFDGTSWCSTNTDKFSNEHIIGGGFWGLCDKKVLSCYPKSEDLRCLDHLYKLDQTSIQCNLSEILYNLLNFVKKIYKKYYIVAQKHLIMCRYQSTNAFL